MKKSFALSRIASGGYTGLGGITGLGGMGFNTYGFGFPVGFVADNQFGTEYIALQVDGTHNIADKARTIPSGLLISNAGDVWNKKVVVEHRRLNLNFTLMSKGTPVGLMVILEPGLEMKHLEHTKKLTLAATVEKTFAWEQMQPVGLVKSVGQGLLTIGSYFGAKRVLPTSWVDGIEYMPVEKGHGQLVPSGWAVPCTHSSAAHIDVIDPIDVPDDDDDWDDDDDDDWYRDHLDTDETGELSTDTISEDISDDNDDGFEHDHDDDSGGGWEYEPYYEGFNGDSDGGFGLYG
jgi:hypothetical protein